MWLFPRSVMDRNPYDLGPFITSPSHLGDPSPVRPPWVRLKMRSGRQVDRSSLVKSAFSQLPYQFLCIPNRMAITVIVEISPDLFCLT